MRRTAFLRTPRLLLPTLVALSLTGCATQEFVQKEVSAVNERISGLESLLGKADQRIETNLIRIQAYEWRLGLAEQSATKLNKRLDDTQTDLASANQNVAGLSVGLNAASGRIDANAAEITNSQKRLVAVEQQIGATSQRVDGAMASLALADGRLGALESAMQPMVKPTEAAAPMAVAPAATPEASADKPAVVEAPAVATVDLQDRLARVGVLVDEVHRRINVNTTSLQSTNLRLGALETGLAATGKRSEDSDAALKAAQETIGAAQNKLAAVESRIDANPTALVQLGQHIDATKADLKTANARLDDAEKHLAQNDVADAAISATAKEALERALAAGKLAEGKLLAETVLTEEVAFGLDKALLSDGAKQSLMAFADKIKAENQNVYIEIQGHTDNSGSAEANLRLSRQRAEAVRDFLNQEAAIPLHRLAVAAYGETRPVADNETREGRINNRRVVLVVLK